MITKEQFLSGAPFHHIETSKVRPYTFEPVTSDASKREGCLYYFGMNEAIVTRVTKSYFDCFTTVMHKVFRTRIYFKDLYI